MDMRTFWFEICQYIKAAFVIIVCMIIMGGIVLSVVSVIDLLNLSHENTEIHQTLTEVVPDKIYRLHTTPNKLAEDLKQLTDQGLSITVISGDTYTGSNRLNNFTIITERGK